VGGKHSRVEDPGPPEYDQERAIDVYPAGGEAGRRARWYLTPEWPRPPSPRERLTPAGLSQDPFYGSATRPQPPAATAQVHSPDPHLGAIEEIGGHRAPRQGNLLPRWANARSLVLAAVSLIALSLLANCVNAGSRQPGTPLGAGTIRSGRSVAPAPGPTTAAPSRSTGQPSSVGDQAAASRRVVVVPNSVCHRYVEARAGVTPLVISVQNSCQ
jgi:hypothetical protein